MEAVVEKANMARAYRRVVANKGAPGADGMTVDQLADHLKQHWPTLRERLLASEYHPSHPSVIRPIAPDWRGACYLGTSLCRCGPYP